MLYAAIRFITKLILLVFRLAGMMLYAPLFVSSRIPRRIRVLLILVLAFGVTPGGRPPQPFPETSWGIALDIGGEKAFGLAMGMVLSFVFVAVQWAGEMIGQQMGFNLGEVFDPQFGGQSSAMGDLYFMFGLLVFLLLGWHRSMFRGVRASVGSRAQWAGRNGVAASAASAAVAYTAAGGPPPTIRAAPAASVNARAA